MLFGRAKQLAQHPGPSAAQHEQRAHQQSTVPRHSRGDKPSREEGQAACPDGARPRDAAASVTVGAQGTAEDPEAPPRQGSALTVRIMAVTLMPARTSGLLDPPERGTDGQVAISLPWETSCQEGVQTSERRPADWTKFWRSPAFWSLVVLWRLVTQVSPWKHAVRAEAQQGRCRCGSPEQSGHLTDPLSAAWLAAEYTD